MWFAYALGTALLAACGVIFAKNSVKRTDFEIVSAIKTLIILLFSWYAVFSRGVQKQIASVSYESIIDLVLLGALISGGLISYHATIKYGGVTRATATERIGSVLILLSGIVVFKQEDNLILSLIGIMLIAAGAIIMITGKGRTQKSKWLLPGLISAVIVVISVVFVKKELIGKLNSYIALALALTVALLISLIAVFIRGITSGIGRVPASEIMFAILSGICFCLSVSLGEKALSFNHDTVSYAVMHLGSVFSVLGASLFFKEKLSWKTACGLLLIVCGIMLMIFLVDVYRF